MDYERANNKLNNEMTFGIKFSAFILLYLLFSVLIGGVLLIFNASELVVGLTSPLSYSLAFFVIIFVHKKLFDGEYKVFSKQKVSVKYLVFGLCLSIGLIFGFGFLNNLFVEFLSSVGISVSSTELDLSSPINYVLYVLALAVVPAVIEESFFRGYLLEKIEGNSIKISLIVGLLFALYHMSLASLLYQFICGFFLTFLTLKSGSVLPSVLAHFINNFIILTLEYFKVNVNFYSIEIIISGILLVAFVFVLTILRTEEKKNKLNYFLLLASSFLGLFLCVILMILGVI